MLFSTWQFILLFLPISFFVYFWLNRRRMVIAGKAWLVAASLFFYSYWGISYLPLMLASILANFAIGTGLRRHTRNFSIRLQRAIGSSTGKRSWRRVLPPTCCCWATTSTRIF